jgi:hypothetical protein
VLRTYEFRYWDGAAVTSLAGLSSTVIVPSSDAEFSFDETLGSYVVPPGRTLFVSAQVYDTTGVAAPSAASFTLLNGGGTGSRYVDVSCAQTVPITLYTLFSFTVVEQNTGLVDLILKPTYISAPPNPDQWNLQATFVG